MIVSVSVEGLLASPLVVVVVVVIDSESSLKMLKLLLKKLNFEADTAENGRVAVEMILRNPEQYYLVFMDNLMPELVRQTDRRTDGQTDIYYCPGTY